MCDVLKMGHSVLNHGAKPYLTVDLSTIALQKVRSVEVRWIPQL
jgi:hypothetical protein